MAEPGETGFLRITQVRSGIGRQGRHRRTLRALGLRRHQQSVVQRDTPAIRGMIRQISYMVSVAPVEAEAESRVEETSATGMPTVEPPAEPGTKHESEAPNSVES